MTNSLILFAAGLGTRMLNLTKNTPKPLVKIKNKTILDYILDMVSKHSFKNIFINSHYYAEKIHSEVARLQNMHNTLPQINIFYEKELLDTGGTVKALSQKIKDESVFTLNCDCLFFSKSNIFKDMLKMWDPIKMDFLMLSFPTKNAIGYTGLGDFDISSLDNKVVKRRNNIINPYIYTGLQILKPNLIASNNKTKFSLGEYYTNNKITSEEYKIYSYIFQGQWCHASCPQDVDQIEKFINNTQKRQ